MKGGEDALRESEEERAAQADDAVEQIDLIQIRFTVAERFDGWRLDHYIQERIPRLSRTRIQKMVRAQAHLGGESLRPAQRVRGGQELVLLRPAPDEPDVPRDFEVLLDDGDLLAIDKPAGLPVHATARFHRNTLTALLRERYPGQRVPTLCHRLDRETSGLMLLAHSRELEVALKKDFFSRRVRKRYLAIVCGELADEGVIDEPIGPDPASGIRIKQRVRDDGQPAQTRFWTLERRGRYALVETAPLTGRQHQIRVHLAARGAPIVGDKLYGDDPTLMLEYLETGWTDGLARRLLLPRQALHAASVSFVHPVTQRQMTLECHLASDLQSFWDALPR